MRRNGLTAFALVFLVLALFLELRLAFWVSLGIPILFFAAIALMPGLDVSGQRAVAVRLRPRAGHRGRRCHRRGREHGTRRSTATVCTGSSRGRTRLAKSVAFAVLTTVAAFSPLLFVPGVMGKVFRVIPLLAIPCLLFSLLESPYILPAHLSHVASASARGPGAPSSGATRPRRSRKWSRSTSR